MERTNKMQDISSLSNINELAITEASLTFKPDFTTKTIEATAVYTLQSHVNGVRTVVLDAKDVEVVRVTPCASWEYGQPHEVFGSGLVINLEGPLDKDQTLVLTIESKTTDKCTAVQFLEAPQTAGKVHPYCYTQNEPTHCRTLLPIQDSPSVKFPVHYTLMVKKPLRAAVGGLFQEESEDGEFAVFKHHQPVPIPAYLIAFAVGDIHSRKVGPRSEVFSEPSVLDAAEYEFGLTEDQLQAAEALMSEYVWGTLNLLVLPPSFGYGGMENPNLIFVTPSLLAGDRSLTNVVAHEIAHSWTGNTVTNANWEHFWLNEGFTVFFERKIVKYLFGRPLAHLQGINGVTSLQKAITVFGEDSNFTRLNPTLTGIDPDDAFSVVPYEKGCMFLTYLESLIGEDAFMQFLQEYIDTFKFKSITSEDFKAFFLSKFPNAGEINWDEWLRGTGMPPYIAEFDASLVTQVDQVFTRWQDPDYQPTSADVAGWHTEQTVLLLNKMSAEPKPHYLLAGEPYGFVSSRNAEIQAAWLPITIKLQAAEHYPAVKTFLKTYGRMKYVRPLFRELIKHGLDALAREIFEECMDFYHPTLISLLKKEFGIK